jgi:hypothetical protein
MMYPNGFARRLVIYLMSDGRRSGEVDSGGGWVVYPPADDESDENPLGGRVSISDADIRPVYDAIVSEGKAFYPREDNERAAMSMIAVVIGETLATDYRAAPRLFNLGEILRRYPS